MSIPVWRWRMSVFERRSAIGDRLSRLALAALVLLLPGACAEFGQKPAGNPFLGVWSTEAHDQVAFRDDTVVLPQPSGPAVPVGPKECAAGFFFHYGQMTSASLTGIAAAQPDVKGELSGLLQRSDYPVAELGCDHGTSTYVLLDDHHLVAIYRDRDVVGLDRMSRL